jgi:hypothetical protein
VSRLILTLANEAFEISSKRRLSTSLQEDRPLGSFGSLVRVHHQDRAGSVADDHIGNAPLYCPPYPQWPRQPITIRSAPSSLAKATISMSTAPILKMIRELHHDVLEGEGQDPG